VSTLRGNPARREPLLWLQLLGLAVLPLEAVLLVLVLAGADPGLFPGFERLLTWALGALGPAVLFWRLQPDLWSLLLLQVPMRARRPDQLRLSALQNALPLKLLASSGAALLLPLVWWIDASAGMAWAWSPLAASPRLVVLLMAVPLLVLMLWQWHQVVQALWMFSRSTQQIEQTLPLTQVEAAEQRLNLGLPLLLLPSLELDPTETKPQAPETPEPPAAVTEPEVEHQPEPIKDPEPDPATGPESEPKDLPAATPETTTTEPSVGTGRTVSGVSSTIPPEQEPEETEGPNLDQQI
jgi:hypothetical protein